MGPARTNFQSYFISRKLTLIELALSFVIFAIQFVIAVLVCKPAFLVTAYLLVLYIGTLFVGVLAGIFGVITAIMAWVAKKSRNMESLSLAMRITCCFVDSVVVIFAVICMLSFEDWFLPLSPMFSCPIHYGEIKHRLVLIRRLIGLELVLLLVAITHRKYRIFLKSQTLKN